MQFENIKNHNRKELETFKRIQDGKIWHKSWEKPIQNIIVYNNEYWNDIELIKIIYDDIILIFDFDQQSYENNWFELPSDDIIQQNDLFSDEYIQFSDLIGNEITGVKYISYIDMPNSKYYNDNVKSYDNNKIYKITLANDKHTFIILRNHTDGWYSPRLEMYMYSKKN